MEIDLDESALRDAADFLGATQSEYARALTRAINRTIASVKSRYGKELARYAGISPSQFLKFRVRAKNAKTATNTPQARFWAGLDEISLAHYKNRQTKKGVRTSAGGKTRLIPHAYMVGKFGGNVFLPEKYIGEAPLGIQFDGKQFQSRKGRAPTGRLAHFWDEGGTLAENTIANAARYASERVQTEFAHELKHILSKRK